MMLWSAPWPAVWSIVGAAAALAWLAVLVLPRQAHRTAERICAASAPADLSDVAVLIPARNEAEHLASTLASLTRQGHNVRVIVVDDRSEDATASIAASFARDARDTEAGIAVEVLAGAPLPDGWGGKLWALEQGLMHVDRPYTLLLDADIELAPNLIPALVDLAKSEAAALVSVMAKLRCRTLWERLLVPPFIFFFKLLYPFALVADPASRVAAAAGGCILVRTDVLREVGAFSKWSDALIDDCTLARHVKRNGASTNHSLRLLMSHDVVSTRGYARLAEFWNMVTRTAYTQLQFSAVLLVATTFAMSVVFAGPFLAMVAADSATGICAGALGLAAMLCAFVPVLRFYAVPLQWGLTLPLAALLFLAMTWHSAINYYTGTRAVWKSRRYNRSDEPQ